MNFYLDGEAGGIHGVIGGTATEEAAAGDVATGSIPGSQSLIMGALEHLFRTGRCCAGGSTSI